MPTALGTTCGLILPRLPSAKFSLHSYYIGHLVASHPLTDSLLLSQHVVTTRQAV